MKKFKLHKNENGFTLIELLIAMAISGLVLAGIMTAYKNQQDSHTAQNQAVDMQQGIRAALYLMTSEIRMAGFDPDADNDVGIIKAGTGADVAERLEFDYVDPDSVAIPPIVIITQSYYLNGSILQRERNSIKESIAENIDSLQFNYLDINGIATAVVDNIRAVQILVTITPDVNERSLNDDRTLSTIVKFRNLGL